MSNMDFFVAAGKELCEELEQLHFSEPDIILCAQQAVKKIRKTLSTFRNQIRKDGFASVEEEISFFKFTKPHINSYLIFYSVITEIEDQKMHLDPLELNEYIKKKERMFRHIMREHLDFVKYYRSGLKHLDELYFKRGANLNAVSRFSTFQQSDPEFYTSHDQVAANIIAFDLFQKHFAPKSEQPKSVIATPRLKWTATKLDLVELVYALQASGAVNHGEAELKEIASALEDTFQIHIGDLYRSFHQISNRKKDQVKFVNRLESDLERKILELEGMI